jgi:hypothetical protein
MASTLHARFESPRLLSVGTPQIPGVYAAPVDSVEPLHLRAVVAGQSTRNCPALRRSMMRRIERVEPCIESRGGHFEHLKPPFSAVT